MISYKKHGGMRFIKVGRLGLTFYVARKRVPVGIPPHIVTVLDRGINDIVETIAYNAACDRSLVLSRSLGHTPY